MSNIKQKKWGYGWIPDAPKPIYWWEKIPKPFASFIAFLISLTITIPIIFILIKIFYA